MQQYAAPSSFPEFEKSVSKPGQSTQEDYPQLFASLIARTAKDIDVLIDSLPSEEASPELQAANLRRLEVENQEAARRLEEVVQQGEALLEQIQRALHDIAQSQLSMQHLDPDLLSPSSSSFPPGTPTATTTATASATTAAATNSN